MRWSCWTAGPQGRGDTAFGPARTARARRLSQSGVAPRMIAWAPSSRPRLRWPAGPVTGQWLEERAQRGLAEARGELPPEGGTPAGGGPSSRSSVRRGGFSRACLHRHPIHREAVRKPPPPPRSRRCRAGSPSTRILSHLLTGYQARPPAAGKPLPARYVGWAVRWQVTAWGKATHGAPGTKGTGRPILPWVPWVSFVP